MGIAALLLVVPLLLLSSPLLVVASVTVTRYRTFSNKMTGLTTLVANFLGAGLVVFPPPLLEDLERLQVPLQESLLQVVFPPPLLEDLAEALDDERHFLIVELGGVNWLSTWCRLLLLFLRRLECNGLSFGCGGIIKLVDLP